MEGEVEDDIRPFERTVDPDAAQRLRELFANWPAPPYRRPLPLLAALLVVAALIAISGRVAWRPVTGSVVFLLLGILFLTLLGMYADWADNYSQAGQLNLPAY